MGTLGALTPVPQHTVVLFDGVCNLCSGAVQFIITRDPKAHFRFASLQSSYGQRQLENFGLDKNTLHSIILIKDNKFYERSDAAFEIARKLKGGWFLLYGFKIVPRFLRDGVYNLIARNRYSFFGRKDACWIPTKELKSRFLD